MSGPASRSASRPGNDSALRILLVRPESTGGIGVHVDSLTRALREAGHDVRTLVATGTGAIPAIRHAARHAQVDVVHAHGLRAGAAACLATRKRTVVTLHNAPSTRAGELLMRLIAQRADAVLAASHELVEAVAGSGAKNAHFGPVVAPALPAPTLPSGEVRRELRGGLGLADDDTRRLVLAVGRLAPQKDYATLLKALILLKDRLGPDGVPPVAIAGEGRLRAALQATIDEHALPVALLGHRADIADLLRAADVFVMCSTWEARPLALQEALRAGVPRIVATDVGGVPEVTAGYLPLISAGDAEALARALAEACGGVGGDAGGGGALGGGASDGGGGALGAGGGVGGIVVGAPDWEALWPGPAEELAAVLAAYSG